jgi:hypothetical protein
MRISKLLAAFAVTALTANAFAGSVKTAKCDHQPKIGRYANTNVLTKADTKNVLKSAKTGGNR